jgi:methionyl aminopeptidase
MKNGLIPIKSAEEIEKMRIAGRCAAKVLEMLDRSNVVKPGVTTLELNELCHAYIIEELKGIPAPLNYKGFPKSICTSVNHQVCHGIPNDRQLKDGDILNIDITVIKDGYHGDTSKMYFVGTKKIQAERLVRVTRECMILGIQKVKPGAYLDEIGCAIQQHAHKHHYSIVEEYCGHGIGKEFHEDPQVLHYKSNAQPKIELLPGMIFTIEPMINAGKRHIKLLPDDWTVVTKDRSLSAQWEHTVLVTENGYEVLTLREDEKDLYEPLATRSQAQMSS